MGDDFRKGRGLAFSDIMNNMPEENSIPQIKPESVPAQGRPESVLIPKIDPQAASTAVPTRTPSNNQPPAINNQQSAIGKWRSTISHWPTTLKSNFGKKPLYIAGGILGFLLLVFLLIFFPVKNFYSKTMAFVAEGRKLADVAKAGKIPAIKSELVNARKSYNNLKRAYGWISWMRIIPWAGGFVSDAGHGISAVGYSFDATDIGIAAVEPYAEILGFGENKEGDGQKTTQERLDFVIKSLPSITPKAGDIAQKVNLAKVEIDKINPDRYPVKFRGKLLREQIRNGIELFDTAAAFTSNAKPLLEAAPYLLGVDKQRTYLVLFQNDKELRPTGGFMTAYSIVTVEKAKFSPTVSSDIYNLDSSYSPTLDAPEVMIKYLKGPYVLSNKLRLRDMNWSPDFAQSMKLFTKEAEKAGITEIDGVIAVDTQLLVNLLDAIGPIGVGGFGNFSTQIEPKCNCPQVIYELESFADQEGAVVWSENEPGKVVFAPPNYGNRKAIIGPLMNSILSNALGQPKEKLPGLFGAAFKSLAQKNVLFYVFDSKAQAGVEAFGLAGRIVDYNGDYLHINDANLGGRKSNLYVKQEVEQNIKISGDGTVEKTLTITYKNPEKQDGWLNSVLPNWTRIYVPKGSQLISSDGFVDKAAPYDDLGKTVFGGYFQLRPEGVSRITLKYRLPFKVKSGQYNLLIQKQPGTDGPLYTINVGRISKEFFLKQDKELKLRI